MKDESDSGTTPLPSAPDDPAVAPAAPADAPAPLALEARSLMLSGITRRLVMLMAVLLATVGLFFYFVLPRIGNGQSYITLIVFAAGLSGGFVSIQQRLDRIDDVELRHLSSSWFTILLIPIYGGVFALLLHVAFVGGIISGALFPEYFVPRFGSPPTFDDFRHFFSDVLPMQAADVARMIFWSFVAGFSERLVPQIVRSSADRLAAEQDGRQP